MHAHQTIYIEETKFQAEQLKAKQMSYKKEISDDLKGFSRTLTVFVEDNFLPCGMSSLSMLQVYTKSVRN